LVYFLPSASKAFFSSSVSLALALVLVVCEQWFLRCRLLESGVCCFESVVDTSNKFGNGSNADSRAATALERAENASFTVFNEAFASDKGL